MQHLWRQRLETDVLGQDSASGAETSIYTFSAQDADWPVESYQHPVLVSQTVRCLELASVIMFQVRKLLSFWLVYVAG